MSDPHDTMLKSLWGKASDRKLRLFVCACCRRIWHLFKDERCRKAVEVAERFADGGTGRGELEAAQVAAEQVPSTVDPRWDAAWGAACEEGLQAAWESLREAAGWGNTYQAERREEVPFLQDIFGNPFRLGTISPTWQTPTIISLAAAAYEERTLPSGELDLARLAVLADALEEAGCQDQSILDHLRSPGPHVRGCWPLDLILGRA
jgi:hypothetical protein